MANKRNFKPHTTSEKKQYANKFSTAQVKSYRAGKKLGFLEGVHKPKLIKKSK